MIWLLAVWLALYDRLRSDESLQSGYRVHDYRKIAFLRPLNVDEAYEATGHRLIIWPHLMTLSVLIIVGVSGYREFAGLDFHDVRIAGMASFGMLGFACALLLWTVGRWVLIQVIEWIVSKAHVGLCIRRLFEWVCIPSLMDWLVAGFGVLVGIELWHHTISNVAT